MNFSLSDKVRFSSLPCILALSLLYTSSTHHPAYAEISSVSNVLSSSQNLYSMVKTSLVKASGQLCVATKCDVPLPFPRTESKTDGSLMAAPS